MRFEAFVAQRYLRSKRRNRFVSLITIISIAGVSVGVTALIVVLSVMTGFDIALQAAIIGNRAHVVLQDPAGPIRNYEQVQKRLVTDFPGVVAAAPLIQVEALFETEATVMGKRSTGGLVLGVDPVEESKVTLLSENLKESAGRRFARGELPKYKEIVLGYLLADRLGVGVGDRVKLVTAQTQASPKGAVLRPIWLKVSGISQAQMSDFDALYTWVDLPTARLLKGMEGVDAIHIKTNDPAHADEIAKNIAAVFGYETQTWRQSQQAFFDALLQEKVAMFIILTFIVLVAAFNIMSTLIMVVMEKRRDIGILRTLGASSTSILVLFVLEGLFIGLTGTFLGVACGYLLAHFLNPIARFLAGLFGLDLFNCQIYFFDRIPVEVVWGDIAWISFAAAVLTFLSTLYPAWSAARLNPVDALRYE
jgi:lipoprotein-releasing system permease protein